jgi:hypothetical protein
MRVESQSKTGSRFELCFYIDLTLHVCSQNTKYPFNILSIRLLSFCKPHALVTQRAANALYQSFPIRIYVIGEVVNHVLLIVIHCEVHNRSSTIS